VLSFTHEGVLDRWAIGTKPYDGSLYFSSSFDLSSPKLIITSGGAATFSSTVNIGTAGTEKLNIFGAGSQYINIKNTTSGADMYVGMSSALAAAYIGTGGTDPIVFVTAGSERMRIDSSGRLGLGTTSTSGYALTVTGVDGTNYSPSSIYRIIARFVNNTSENKGIGIGYHTNSDINAACIYGLGQGSAAFPAASLAFGVYNRSTSAYVIKFLISENTVKITNIPTDVAGLGTGDLYRDALGYVKIAY